MPNSILLLPCDPWTGQRTRDGYGLIEAGSNGIRRRRLAHLELWERVFGPILEGLQLDHLCRVRLCVELTHLEPVTVLENNRRRNSLVTHCPRHHPYDEANTYICSRGWRQCRTCWNERRQKVA